MCHVLSLPPDFGSAKLHTKRGQATTLGGGTEGWQSPEAILGEGATPASDVFSCGLVFFFVLTGGKHPFGDDEAKRARLMVKFAFADPDDAEEVAEADAKVQKRVGAGLAGHDPEATELVAGMLRHAPSERPSAVEVLRSALLREALDAHTCPLSFEVMRDPVITADGQTYEREEIERWFATGKRSSPLTGKDLESTALLPNIALRNAIAEM